MELFGATSAARQAYSWSWELGSIITISYCHIGILVYWYIGICTYLEVAFLQTKLFPSNHLESLVSISLLPTLITCTQSIL